MYQLRYREELPQPVVRELDDFIAFLQHYLGVSLNEDGTVKATAVTGATDTPSPATGGTTTAHPAALSDSGEEHWWKSGPWTFDDPNAANPHVAEIIPVFSSGAISINDWAPQGIDNAVIITISQNSGNLIITGMKAPVGGRRRLVLISNTSAYTVTLKNTSASSQPINRFFTGANVSATTDIVLASGQNIWLFHNGGGWTNAITPQQSGGTFGEGSTGFPSTFTNIQYSAPLTLITGQIDTLNATPITIIPAPGANKIAIITGWTIQWTNSGAWTNSGTNFRFQYNGQTQQLTSALAASQLGAAAGTRLFTSLGVQTAQLTGGGVNTAIEVTCTSDANPGAQTGTMKIVVTYYILDVS